MGNKVLPKKHHHHSPLWSRLPVLLCPYHMKLMDLNTFQRARRVNLPKLKIVMASLTQQDLLQTKYTLDNPTEFQADVNLPEILPFSSPTLPGSFHGRVRDLNPCWADPWSITRLPNKDQTPVESQNHRIVDLEGVYKAMDLSPCALQKFQIRADLTDGCPSFSSIPRGIQVEMVYFQDPAELFFLKLVRQSGCFLPSCWLWPFKKKYLVRAMVGSKIGKTDRGRCALEFLQLGSKERIKRVCCCCSK